MRQIDADALKAYIDAQIGRPFIGCTVGEALKILVDEQPTVEPEPRWIPCSERLPEERGLYIVTEKVFSLDDRERKGRYKIMVEQVGYCDGKWQRASFFEVVAWMPFPKPYKESEQDDQEI